MSLTPDPTFICPITHDVMENAVTDKLGVSYDETAILQWLNSGHTTSPANQQPLSVSDLRPNLALRAQIEKYKKRLNGELDESDEEDAMDTWEFNEEDTKFNIDCARNNTHTVISVTPSLGTTKTPSDICCVVDVSGSMDTEATMKGADGSTESHGLSILDIVKHALKTIVAGLSDNDRFALVKYSDNAQVVMSITEMDIGGKAEANSAIDSLKTEGRTNLWDGIHKGLDVIRAAKSTKNASVFVLTDGLPNISPSRGELHELQRYKEKHGNIPCSVNTFGFGYSLDSQLLQSLAVNGNGSFGFIPDSGMVGTIFVNAMSNQLTTAATNAKLYVEFNNGSYIFNEADSIHTVYNWDRVGDELVFDLGSIQFGQSKDIVIPVPSNGYKACVTLKYNVPGISAEKVQVQDFPHVNVNDQKVYDHFVRQRVVEYISKLIGIVGYNTHSDGYGSAYSSVDSAKLHSALNVANSLNFTTQLSNFSGDIMKDFNGQVKEALSTTGNYQRWGIHYLLSLSSAHLNQKRNNFKDPGVQHYGGKLFDDVVDRLDDAFNKLPPPKPSKVAYSSRGVNRRVVTSMSSYNSCSNPCFHGDSTVTSHYDGKRIKFSDLKKGNTITSSSGIASTVQCIIKTKCANSSAEFVTFEDGLKITLWHPIEQNSKWVFPSDVGVPVKESCDYVYNIIMEDRQSIIVNGVTCCTLGHNIEGNVIGHKYFGTDAVVNDFSRMPGWNNGLIELDSDAIMRDDSTNLVVGIAMVGSE